MSDNRYKLRGKENVLPNEPGLLVFALESMDWTLHSAIIFCPLLLPNQEPPCGGCPNLPYQKGHRSEVPAMAHHHGSRIDFPAFSNT
jgi:hypothetical protein